MKTLRTALAAALVTSGSTILLPGAADAQVLDSLRNRTSSRAQRQQQQQQPQDPEQPAQPRPPADPNARQYNLSRAEQQALQPALQAAQASDWAAATAALPAAQAAARGADAKYLIGQIRLRIGIETSNTQLQSQAIDELIASGGAQQDEMQRLYQQQLRFATAAGDTAKAARAQAELDRLNPNDPNIFLRQVDARVAANDAAGAVALLQQAMQRKQAAGEAIPAEWRQRAAVIAYQGRLPQATGLFREWLTAAPSPTAWHDALAVLAQLGNANTALKLDIYRLMRAAGAMTRESDFIELSQAANEARALGEVKAALEEGTRRNLITTNMAYARDRLGSIDGRIATDRASLAGERRAVMAGNDGPAARRLAEAYFGYGEYPAAIELYRAALQKGGEDPNLVNTRLGAALALSGQRAEAEAAFRAVTGPRAELAQYWLLFLSTRP